MPRLATLVVAAAVAAPLVLPAGAAAAPAPRSIFQDDQTLLRSGDARRERALDELAALGVDAIRVLVVWRDVAPEPRLSRTPDAYALGAVDALVAGAARRGLDVLLTPTGPGPAWASPCRGGRVAERQACRPDPGAFGRFVAVLGQRYPGVRHWSVWNEPNNPRWLWPQYDPRGRPAAPEHYRRLVRAAREALRATGHGRDELLIGETAPIGLTGGPLATRPMMPGTFLRALLCARCGTLGATGLAHHAYTRGGTQPPRFPALRGELSVSALADVVRLARGLPVHLTEGGWQTSPPDPFFGVSPARQAAYLNETEWLARSRRGVRSVAQYLLFDELRPSSFQSGLRFADGRAKPALAAYRLPIWVVRRGRSVTVWGRVRPGGGGTVEVQRRLRGGRAWRTVARAKADDDVLVRLRSTPARWRLRWNAHISRTATEARR